MAERTLRRAQPADERVDRARRRGPARPVLAGVVVLDAVADEVDELAERRRSSRRRSTTAVVAEALAVALEPSGDVVDHHRVLLALVLGVGEQERQQLLLDELGDRPVEGVRAEGAGGDVGRRCSDRPCGASRRRRPSRTGWARGRCAGSAHGRWSARRMLAWSRNSRSSPFTLKISALVLIASAPSTPELKRE